jgi:hypothetical protein
MSYLERSNLDIEKTLKGFRFEFSRAAILEEAFKDNLSSYIADAFSEESFEAQGVLVTGPSRAGKTKEVQHLLNEFHAAEVMMPNGKPAKVVTCILKGSVTWKDLGKKVLTTLGYDLKGNLSQNEIWDRVSIQSELQNVIGIHFDECQHMFRDTTRNTNEVIIDSFKAVMKDSRYPMMLILSGVPKLEEFINAPSVAAEQIRPLLTSVRFANIHLPDDEETMVDLLIELCDLGGVGYEKLQTEDLNP